MYKAFWRFSLAFLAKGYDSNVMVFAGVLHVVEQKPRQS